MFFFDLLILLRLTHITIRFLLYADSSSHHGRATVLEICMTLCMRTLTLLVSYDVLLLSSGGEDGLNYVQNWSFELINRHD